MTDRQENTNIRQQPKKTASEISDISDLTNRQLRDIFEGGNGRDPLPGMIQIYRTILPNHDPVFLEQIHNDTSRIFSGDLLSFKQSTTKYHDLRHTRNVSLATLRLFHGLHCQEIELPADIIKLGMICAYFHDTGMLLTVKDSKAHGAAYLKIHEERSIKFVREYLRTNSFPTAYIDNCEPIINCTNLTVEPETIHFESSLIKLTGHILGTADILAQMADRYYLECLPLLYLEQQDAGIEQHASSLALMRQTTMFYHEVIERRLYSSFKGVCNAMEEHFREWHRLKGNLYKIFIEKNIRYLEEVVRKYDAGAGELSQYLRRRQPKVS